MSIKFEKEVSGTVESNQVNTGCDHLYEKDGVRYCDGSYNLPGTGASRRYYAHVWFCKKCLKTRGKPIPDPGSWRPQWTTYDDIRFGATPGTPDECGVPLDDRDNGRI